MEKLYLENISRFFKRVYLVSLIVSLLYVLVCAPIGFIAQSPTRYETLSAGGFILIQSVLFFFWFRIFRNLENIFKQDSRREKNQVAFWKICKNLVIVFFVNLFDHFLLLSFPDILKPVNWSSIHWPELGINPFEYAFGVLAMYFKIYHYWKDFFFPNVEGIAILILAAISYYLSKENHV